MKKLLNVLYVITENSYISKQGETICVHVSGVEKVRVPAHTLESIVCFGNTTISTPLIEFCSEHGIGLTFLSQYGRFYGRLEGATRGNVLLRRAQYRAAESEQCLEIARNIVAAKIANSRQVLMRAARESATVESGERLRSAVYEIAKLSAQALQASSLDELRGVEGIIANRYYSVFNDMIRANKESFQFVRRSKRPPRDRINALLSYLYVLLAHDVRAALEGVGLDPAVGYLHAMRPGRASLALDLMEELRAPLCDRLALALVNLRQLQPDDFDIEGTEVRMSESARRTVLAAWQKRKREEIQHPYLNEKVPIGLIPHLQAQLMARYLRQDIDSYPPLLWK